MVTNNFIGNKMKRSHYLSFLIFCLLVINNLVVCQDNQTKLLFDGPHIFYNNDSLYIKYYDDGITKTFHIKMEETTIFHGFLQDSTNLYIIPKQFEIPPDKYLNVENLFVVSDIHGQYKIFKELLLSHNIIDQNNSWIWGNGHLVIIGDVFDRGDEVHEALWLIYNLEQQAKKMGGAVHFLLGNHEVMVLQDDLRYVNSKYTIISDSFSITVPELYGKNTFLGRWLRSKNFLIQIGLHLFVHGGIHPELITQYNSITDINRTMIDNIDIDRGIIKSNPTLALLFRNNGPVWYRGFFTPDSLPDVSDIELTSILNHFNVERIIVGHTTRDSIYSSHNQQIICVDGGIKFGVRGEGLLIKNSMYYRVDTNSIQQRIF